MVRIQVFHFDFCLKLEEYGQNNDPNRLLQDVVVVFGRSLPNFISTTKSRNKF